MDNLHEGLPSYTATQLRWQVGLHSLPLRNAARVGTR
jgi:hypothetical protein